MCEKLDQCGNKQSVHVKEDFDRGCCHHETNWKIAQMVGPFLELCRHLSLATTGTLIDLFVDCEIQKLVGMQILQCMLQDSWINGLAISTVTSIHIQWV